MTLPIDVSHYDATPFWIGVKIAPAALAIPVLARIPCAAATPAGPGAFMTMTDAVGEQLGGLGVSQPTTEQEIVMADVLAEVLDANNRYAASFGERGKLPLPPARHFAILTCMDARLDPAKYAGLVEGDAHVIRNAGGRATDDAIRSLVISYKLLGTNEWFVIHHTDCGMQLFDDQVIASLLENSLETASIDAKGWHDHGRGPGSHEGHYIKWHSFTDLNASVVEDVRRIRAHLLVPRRIPIHGYVYDVRSGRLLDVPGAKAAGAVTG